MEQNRKHKFRHNNNAKIFADPIRFEHDNTDYLSKKLQTSLNIDEILQIFFTAVNRQLQVNYLAYNNHIIDKNIELGSDTKFSSELSLRIENTNIGNIKFGRDEKFSQVEIFRLEAMVADLLYPLYNSIKYFLAKKEATTCPLTGLHNRNYFNQILQREINFSQRYGTPLSLIMIDIDNFKHINDTYGHPIGDSILAKVGNFILQTRRDIDSCFRIGGEEFAILLPRTPLIGAYQVASRIQAQLNIDTPLKITLSQGVSELEKGGTGEKLYIKADKAMYYAKRAGKNRIKTIYS